jgi:ribonucleoside-triphosphate reductase
VFSSISFGADVDERARRICKAILSAYDAGLGKGEMPMFPNLMMKVASGINLEPGTPNHDILVQSLQVTSRRMNPTYVNCGATFNKEYGTNATYMGCRSRVMADRHGESKAEDKGNIAFVTVNLPRLAIESKSTKEFMNRLNKVLSTCEEQLIHRWNVLRKLRVRDIPFIFGEGIYVDSGKLSLDDTIEESLKHGTLTIGFIGCAEMCTALFGKNHFEDKSSWDFAYSVISHIRDFTDSLSNKYDLNFSVIATPAEGLSGRFVKIDKRKYGVIQGVTDKEHYTNSFHCPVSLDISVADKVKGEAPFHKLCNGGHISYVEMSGPPLGNTEGLYALLKFMCECDMGYFGYNYPIDFCNNCSLLGVIPDEGCPKCGATDIRRVRRVTGYFSTLDKVGNGKEDEINLRTSHAGRTVLCD